MCIFEYWILQLVIGKTILTGFCIFICWPDFLIRTGRKHLFLILLQNGMVWMIVGKGRKTTQLAEPQSHKVPQTDTDIIEEVPQSPNGTIKIKRINLRK